MTKRKITLLIITAVLLVIAILQGVVTNINPVKSVKFEADPDTILIESSSGTVKLAKHNGEWWVGDNNFQAKKTDVNSFINCVKEIKILEKIGSVSNELLEERYDLNKEKALKVTASLDGKTLRTLLIGKATSTAGQSYLTIDDKKDVYLVSGNYNTVFNKTEENLKSEYVFDLSSNDIINVNVTMNGSTWGVVRNSKLSDAPEWAFTGAAEEKEIDNSKANSWVQQLGSLKVNSWVDDSTVLPSNHVSTLNFQIGQEVTTVDVYKEGSGDSAQYICTSNRTPHKFELTSFNAGKYSKAMDDLIKQ